MKKLNDKIILDPQRFDQNTRKWNVPILNLKGLTAISLYIDNLLIDPGNYSIANNFIALGEGVDIVDGTNASLIVEYSESEIKIKFWLPIILATIGLAGSLGQPILHNLGFIYQPKFSIAKSSWGYDIQKHHFIMKLRVKNLTQINKNKWQVYVGTRIRDNSVDVQYHKYSYIAGPYNLTEVMDTKVLTELKFSCKVGLENVAVQGAVFLIEKDMDVPIPFEISKFSKGKVQFYTSASVTMPEASVMPKGCNE